MAKRLTASWETRKTAIKALKDSLYKKTSGYDAQDLHLAYVNYLAKHPDFIDLDALANRDIEQLDRLLRPEPKKNGQLFDRDPNLEIPYAAKKRIKLNDAQFDHVVGWNQVIVTNYANVTAAHSSSVTEIKAIFEAFHDNPDCRTWGDLKRKHDRRKSEMSGNGEKQTVA